ncbi:MAG: hypothetical protein FWE77_02125 [Clostridia bacterium]|nr:hypothetical protein [Clostridia bacterium]
MRFALTGGLPDQAAVPLAGVRCRLRRGKTEMGAYITDASGHAVTSPLAPGDYTVHFDGLPEGFALPDGLRAGQPLTVEPAALVESAVLCPPLLTGRWTVCVGEVDEDGQIAELPVDEADFAVLYAGGGPVPGADGAPLRVRSGADGGIELTLPAGAYLLQPPRGNALAGALEEPAAFVLPQERDAVTLRARRTRLVVRPLREDGARLEGAAYRAVGPGGQVYELTAGSQGQAVSPALEPGAYRVETASAPEGFGPAEAMQVQGEAGVPAQIDMVHKPLGRLEVTLRTQALSARGEVRSMPLAGANVGLLRLADGAQEGDLSAYAAYPAEGAPLMLVTDAQGVARDAGGALPALSAGVYRAFAGDMPGLGEAGLSDPVRVEDGERPALEWALRSEQGGVRVALRDAEDARQPLGDAAFALIPLDPAKEEELQGDPLTVDEDGVALRVQLPRGRYRLRQTRWPEGYDPAPEREIEVMGGALTEVELTNARRGTLGVDKLGFTFSAELQQFRVPLGGAYGVYVLHGDAYEPYPSREEQVVIAAHGMRMDGAVEAAELPAAVEGAAYYLRELESAVSPGYVADAGYHEARVYPGRHTRAEIVAVADKGFFVLSHYDLDDWEGEGALTGAEYALYALAGGTPAAPVWAEEPALAFAMTRAPYQNEMALPVGAYLLRMLRAPAGYMLDGTAGDAEPGVGIPPIERIVDIPPYMSRGNPTASVEMWSMRVPAADGKVLASAYLPAYDVVQNLQFYPPDAQADIVAVQIGGGRDAAGAQVLYRLAQGGWNWADVRTVSGPEGGVQSVDLSDVDGRIVALQIRYPDAQDGRAWHDYGFSTGEIRLAVAGEQALPGVGSDWTFTLRYLDEEGESQTRRVSVPTGDAVAERAEGRAVRPDPGLETGGSIVGVVHGEHAGAWVQLESLDGQDVHVSARAVPDARGAFRFDDVAFGAYRLRFVPAEGELVAGIAAWDGTRAGERVERGEGLSEPFVLDGAQRWHWAEAQVERTAVVRGALLLEEQRGGVSGVPVSLWQGEVCVAEALTDAQGRYVLAGLPAGNYALRAQLPEGMIYAAAEQAEERPLSLLAGEEAELGPVLLTLPASLAGSLLADGGTRGVPSAGVELLRDGFESPVRAAVTDARGGFAFEGLTPGAYRLRISLPAAYAFPLGHADPARQGALAMDGAARGETERFVLAMGEAKDGLLIEALRPARLTVSAWEDADYSGIRGEDAGGVAGVRVALAPERAPEDRLEDFQWRSTGPDGVVQFERLEPGAYQLWYELPGAWRLTRRTDEHGGQLPMQPGAFGRGQRIVLGDGQSAETGIGLVLPASVRGAVWQDADDNGLWDAGEAPWEGAEVWLYDQDGAMGPWKAVTDAAGAYAFDEIPPGAYLLAFAAPEGAVLAAGAEPSRQIRLELGQALAGENMGVVPTAQVRGVMWEDVNDDGTMDPNETGIPGAHVLLYRLVGTRGQRTLVAEQALGADGTFVFAGLRPGTYQLECALPDGYVAGRAVPSALRFEAGRPQDPLRSVPFALAMGQELENVALAALRLGSLSGAVWEDGDYDGLRGPGEGGLSGATVALWRAGGAEPLAAVETGRSGAYRFGTLPPGDYVLRFALPEGYVFTRASGQSLVQEGGREAEFPVTLAMGEDIAGLDAGALMPAVLGGLVWIDTNNDGMLDANEPAMPGVMLELLRADDPAQAVAAAQSDEWGRWRIHNVMPGAYLLRAVLPEGYLFAAGPRARSHRAGNIHGVDGPVAIGGAIELKAGQRMDQYHFGCIPAASIEGQAWLDEDDGGLRSAGDPALSGVRVMLLAGGEVVASAETGERGEYHFGDLRPGAYALRFVLPDGHLFARAPQGEGGRAGLVHGLDVPVGESAVFPLAMGEQLTGLDTGALRGAAIQGAVWLDADENGAWDPGEAGLAGALVELVQADTGEVLASLRTPESGAFHFDYLRPGAYRVRIDLPEGDLFATQAAEKLTLHDTRLGTSLPLRLAMGEEADIGPVAALHGASVSGTAWEDADVKGRFGPGDAPLTGTGVVLLRREGGDWGAVGAWQVDEEGAYRFDGLHPGVYSVRFTLPTGYLFTDYLPDAQGRCSKVPMVDGREGQTEAFELAMGEARADQHAGGIRPGMVGDYAWVDENGNGLQDYGEPPLPGVQVTLFAVGPGGALTEVGTVSTDQYGLYRFDGLRPGLYRLRAALPAGYTFTVNRTDLPEIASAIPEGSGPAGESADFTVRSGQARRNIDIGARRSGR